MAWPWARACTCHDPADNGIWLEGTEELLLPACSVVQSSKCLCAFGMSSGMQRCLNVKPPKAISKKVCSK
eukprot:scaffold27824_cov17-Tisochrysis_lutea.AAC.4